jgi:hypothetical protein
VTTAGRLGRAEHDEPQAPRGQGDLPLALRLSGELGGILQPKLMNWVALGSWVVRDNQVRASELFERAEVNSVKFLLDVRMRKHRLIGEQADKDLLIGATMKCLGVLVLQLPCDLASQLTCAPVPVDLFPLLVQSRRFLADNFSHLYGYQSALLVGTDAVRRIWFVRARVSKSPSAAPLQLVDKLFHDAELSSLSVGRLEEGCVAPHAA